MEKIYENWVEKGSPRFKKNVLNKLFLEILPRKLQTSQSDLEFWTEEMKIYPELQMVINKSYEILQKKKLTNGYYVRVMFLLLYFLF
jgi:hypothetical protein